MTDHGICLTQIHLENGYYVVVDVVVSVNNLFKHVYVSRYRVDIVILLYGPF